MTLSPYAYFLCLLSLAAGSAFAADSCPDIGAEENRTYAYLNAFRADPATQAARLGLTLAARPTPPLRWNPELAKIARAYAEQMGRTNFFDHIDPAGRGPNQRLLASGYRLPDDYPRSRTSNSVEAIASGQPDGIAAINELILARDGGAMREQLLGLTPFWRRQTEVGVGIACIPGSTFSSYYVLLTAPARPPR